MVTNLTDGGTWRIIASQEATNDLMLAVDRGIPASGHTQVVSYHVTNQPEQRHIEAFVAKFHRVILDNIESFIQHANSSSLISHDTGYSEFFAIMFMRNLLKFIVDGAVKIMEEEWDSA